MRKALFLSALLTSTHAFSGPGIQVANKRHLLARDLKDGSLQLTPRAGFDSSYSSQLRASRSSNNMLGDEGDVGPSSTFNAPAAVLWISLVSFAFLLAPGETFGGGDQAMIQKIIENPLRPEGVNELFLTVFNIFGVVPLLLAALVLPQGQKRGIPAFPFLAGATFLGYFALGPYLVFRAPPRTRVDMSTDLSWFTKNVVESSWIPWVVVALTLSLPVQGHLFEVQDWEACRQGFMDLLSTSRLASASCADLTCLHLSLVALTVRDVELRTEDADRGDAVRVALATAFLPFLGTAFYWALRPKLLVEN